ncbi:Ig-like domain-containing protein [Pedococcus aerophilus]
MSAVRPLWRALGVAVTLVLALGAASPAQAARPARGTVDIVSPADGSSGTQMSPTVSGKATAPTGQVLLSVDGTQTDFPATVGSRGTWSTAVFYLSLGTHQICAEVRSDVDVQLAVDCVTYTVVPDPSAFDVDWPLAGGTTATLFQVQGSCQDGTDVLVSLDGGATRTESCSGGSYYSQYLTSEGTHSVVVSLAYQGRVLSTVTRSFSTKAPPAVDVNITTPADASTVSSSFVYVAGTSNSPSTPVVLTVNGGDPRETYFDADGTWSGGAPLTYGDNIICATSNDIYGTSDRDCVTIRFAIDPTTLTLTRPTDGGASGTFIYYEGSCFTGTQLRIELDGALYQDDTCYYDHFGGSIPYVADGPHVVSVTMSWDGSPIASVSASVVVDTLAPAPPTVLSPASGATIRSAPVTVTGTAESGANVELVTTRGDVVLTAPVAADGTWSMTLDRAYLAAQGVVTGQRETLRLRFEAVDPVGNRSFTTVATYTVRMR